MVITATIAVCETTIAANPSVANLLLRITADDRRTCFSGRMRSAWGSSCPLTANGSGRNRRATMASATSRKNAAKKKGPMN